MSAPDANAVRQRGQTGGNSSKSTDPQTENPASLGGTSSKNVRRKTPAVNPPFWNMSMNRFLTYMALSLVALLAFYTWRFTVWAHQAGGYWNLMTGKRAAQAINPNAPSGGGGVDSEALIGKAAASAASAASAAGAGSTIGAGSAVKGSKGKTAPAAAAAGKPDVQSQIFALASALGVSPHDLTTAIRPLIDPSVPNPAEAAAKEIELLKIQLQGLGAAAAAGGGAAAEPAKEAEEAAGPGLLGLVSEALLD